jgi:hypothetical protein
MQHGAAISQTAGVGPVLVFMAVAFTRWLLAFSMAKEGKVRVRSMMQELLVLATLATGAAYHIALVVAVAAALT